MSEISMQTQQLEKSAREKVSRENLKAHIDYLCSLGEKLAGTDYSKFEKKDVTSCIIPFDMVNLCNLL